MTLETSVPVLRVSDYPAARAFWHGKLGFAVFEEAGEPVVGFGILKRDAARVFLTAWDGPEAPYAKWRAYFHTSDLDGLIAEWSASGVEIKGPTHTFYGMREIEVSDPDGNCLCFGQDA